jgi:hypothetical protein
MHDPRVTPVDEENTRAGALGLILIILSCGALLASATLYGWWQ